MMRVLRKIAKQIPLVPFMYRTLRNLPSWYAASKLKRKNTDEVFAEIYRGNIWGGKSSASGTGSDNHQTRIIASELPRLIDDFNITSMLDIPCGDFFWMKTVNLKGIRYIGADIVNDLIHKNKEMYEKDNISFERLDLIRSKLPSVDLIFCRDCLVHFSFEDIFSALQRICECQSGFLITTTFTDRKDNYDIATGQWRTLNLEAAPFMFPKPLRIINEGCTESNGRYKDKSLALWRTNDIRDSLIKRSK